MKNFTPLFLLLITLQVTAQTRVRSTATGGSWNSTSTWVGGTVPGPNDTTEIAAGATVTVNGNSTNTVCGRLEVSGTVEFSADAYPLIINGPLEISSTGVFKAVKASTSFAKAVTIHGSINNNGTLYAPYAIEGTTPSTTGGITMGQASAITGISGTGTFSVFRQLTIDNPYGVNLNVVLSVSSKLILHNGLFNNRTNLTLNNTSVGTGPNGAATSSGNIRLERSQLSSLDDPMTVGGSASYFVTYYTNTTGAGNMITEGYELPSSRSLHGITVNNGGGVKINDNLTVISASVPLVLTNGIVNVAKGKTLTCSNTGYAGSSGATASFVQGGLSLSVATTAANRTFPVGFGDQRRQIVLKNAKASTGTMQVRFEIVDTAGGTGATGITIAPSMKRRGSIASGSLHSFTGLTFTLGTDENDYAVGNIASSATWNGTYQDMGEGSRTLTTVSSPESSYTSIRTYAMAVPDVVWSGVMDSLRTKWTSLLTGSPFNISDPDIATRVASVNTSGYNNWNSMIKDTAGRTRLWADIDHSSSADITTSYSRLKLMATAYATEGAALYHNDTLKNDITWALDWLYRFHYNEHITVPTTGGTNNWWDYRIGAPLRLNDIVILMYDSLDANRRFRYMAAVDNSTPNAGDYTGANLAWVSTVIAIRAIVVKSPSKLLYARNSLSPVFQYVSSGDGFYTDGSFIQHNYQPYNGAYGLSLFTSIADILFLYGNTSIDFTDPARNNVIDWVYNAFEPLIYKGAMMSMVRGREISRASATEHIKGRNFTEALIEFSDIVPASDGARMKKLAKHYLLTDSTFATPYTSLGSIHSLKLAKALINDAGVSPRAGYNIYQQFAGMDRAVQHTANYAIGVSMHSTRTYNYERINDENLKGWHLSDGMTYLYNKDQQQYDNFYWPTVNMYRLPGTTVKENTTATQNRNNQSAWAGGTSLLGRYGVSGIQLSPYGTTLLAKKAWFFFGNKMVALGAGIKNSDNENVSTYIDQRKIPYVNTATFMVNGVTQSSSFGTEASPALFNNVSWAHLSSVTGADIGYYFPDAPALRGLRQEQTGRWSDIASGESTTLRTQRFITLWQPHGNHANDNGASYNKYAYVLLPGFSASETEDFADNPDVTILRNEAGSQAVHEPSTGITGAVFWGDANSYIPMNGDTAYLYCNKKAAVMLMEKEDTIAFAVSDPTQLNTGTITIRLHNTASSVLYSSPNISVTRLTPDIQFTVDVAGLKGATSELILAKTTSPFMAFSKPETMEHTNDLSFDIIQSTSRRKVEYVLQTRYSGPGTITLMDISGREIFSKAVNVARGQNRSVLHVPYHPSGVYVAVLKLNGKTYTSKYIR
ncbi:polysaccharide lyase family 8 super-sandwich domain-containing protein [Chitinophaga cymbidii]|uniref:Uncharacterized protein n=1 Tax=Chitinophaga cymbidii TaxID=1096750 RepID=A0A512RFW2_9BACT|nr:polysaccharide lyase family 8 super-sandwich domain-containing protein [Chitinophaga cymbidii]GEP94596.1 hypothetical protein CCY01nite_08560 [Chitinophaga cymbidii]